MKHFVLLCTLALLCACKVTGKTSWEPPEGGANVSLAKFLDTSLYIWTLYATSSTQSNLCKVDKVLNMTKTDVYFSRNYTMPSQLRMKSELLRGEFQDWQRKQGPSIMQLYNAGGKQLGAEEIVYQDQNNTCGIFFTTLDHRYAGQYYETCELRVKGGSAGANASTECLSQFNETCEPEKIISVYTKPSLCISFNL